MRTTTMRRRALTGGAVLMWGLLAVACSDPSASDRDRSADALAAGEEVAATVAGDVAADGGADLADASSGGRGATEVSAQVDLERIVYVGTQRVRVEDPAAAARDALDLVEAAGGSLAGQDERAGGEVSLTVRVPVARFRPTLDDVAALGVELERTVEAEEVTDQVVDLRARLTNARASADRLRALFADAGDVNQVVAIETALTQREAEVESLAGQLQSLEDRADRSTLSIRFVEEGDPVVDDEPDDDPAFVDGLQAGWGAMQGAGSVLAGAAGFLLPVTPLLLAAAIAFVVVRRRRTPAPAAIGPDAP